uniref:Pept_C1 domain-containing protein n=1 Tax=Syphacia muris TaxID=451379 RepID=A0A0N5ADU0_9BILA
MWMSTANFCFPLLIAILLASQVKPQTFQRQWYKRHPYLSLTRPITKRHGPQLNNPRWIKRHCVGRRPLPISGIANCSAKIDAITKAPNNCIYAFASSMVYEICVENGLPHRAVYDISQLFPRGPNAVTAAVTNVKSGITILINHRVVYRYIWVNNNLPFCVSS